MTGKEILHKIVGPAVVSNAPAFIIFSSQKSERLNYVCEFIFNRVLKSNFVSTNDLKEFEISSHYKINYSGDLINGAFNIFPHALLFEKNVSEKKPDVKNKNSIVYFFNNNDPRSFHFDIFSAVFYSISRYEEWQQYEKDDHGRFELKESIFFKNNVHLKPITEIWIEEFRNELLKLYAPINFPLKEFKTIATIDVDNLFAYKHKGLLRTIGAGLKDFVKFDFANIMRRNSVINGADEDPFDIYEKLSEFCYERKIPLLFFFLFRTGTKFDRTVDPKSKAFNKAFDVIKSNAGIIGLHPSYFSSTNANILQAEAEQFSEKLGGRVKFSRQHYLKFDIRTTPALLLKNDIDVDFSMGFASGAGFRAGTSQPFFYYDFNTEKKTELLFMPFCAMDGAYFVYNNISPEEAYAALQKIKEEVKKVDGIFTTVFHERTFAQHLYPGFGDMYMKLLAN